MPPRMDRPFAQQASQRRRLVMIAGLLALVVMANGVVNLFALQYSNDRYLADLKQLHQAAAGVETARNAQVHFKIQVQEWKNTLLRGADPQDFARYQASFQQEERVVNEQLKTLTGLARQIGLTAPEIDAVIGVLATLGSQYRKALQDFRPADVGSARVVDRQVRGADRPPTDQMDRIVAEFQARAGEIERAIEEDTATRYRTLRAISTSGTAVGVLLVLIFLALSRAMVPKA